MDLPRTERVRGRRRTPNGALGGVAFERPQFRAASPGLGFGRSPGDVDLRGQPTLRRRGDRTWSLASASPATARGSHAHVVLRQPATAFLACFVPTIGRCRRLRFRQSDERMRITTYCGRWNGYALIRLLLFGFSAAARYAVMREGFIDAPVRCGRCSSNHSRAYRRWSPVFRIRRAGVQSNVVSVNRSACHASVHLWVTCFRVLSKEL